MIPLNPAGIEKKRSGKTDKTRQEYKCIKAKT